MVLWTRYTSRIHPKEQTAITSEEEPVGYWIPIVNTSVILMSIMMGAFSQLMVNTTGCYGFRYGRSIRWEKKPAAKSRGGPLNKNCLKQKRKWKIWFLVFDKICIARWNKKSRNSRAAFWPKIWVGPKIIDRYDFKLPKLTQEIGRWNISHDIHSLLISEDSQFAEMFKGLTEWLNHYLCLKTTNSRFPSSQC